MGGVGTSNSRNRNAQETPYYNMSACGGKRYQNRMLGDQLCTGKLIVLGFFLLYLGFMCAFFGKALVTPSTPRVN